MIGRCRWLIYGRCSRRAGRPVPRPGPLRALSKARWRSVHLARSGQDENGRRDQTSDQKARPEYRLWFREHVGGADIWADGGLRRCMRHLNTRLPGLEVRDDLFAEEAESVQHLLVLRWPDGAQQNDLLDAEGLVELEKADAVFGRADAEFGALLAHFLRCRLARMRPAGEALVARVITLVIGRHGVGIIIAPHQARALALLLDVPPDELGAAPGHDIRVLVAVSGGHQRGARGRPGAVDQ